MLATTPPGDSELPLPQEKSWTERHRPAEGSDLQVQMWDDLSWSPLAQCEPTQTRTCWNRWSDDWTQEVFSCLQLRSLQPGKQIRFVLRPTTSHNTKQPDLSTSDSHWWPKVSPGCEDLRSCCSSKAKIVLHRWHHTEVLAYQHP